MAQLTAEEAKVLEALIRQAVALTFFTPVDDEGRLVFFREALELEAFPMIADLVHMELNRELFASCEEIERMEVSYFNQDSTELVVQCCLILELVYSSLHNFVSPENEEYWLFGDYVTLEGIAYMRHRLNFIRPTSAFRSYVNTAMARAAQRWSDDADPSWQMLLPLLREAGANCGPELLKWSSSVLGQIRTEIPKPAADLILSLLAEAIYFSSTTLEMKKCPVDGATIVKLLDCGASLATTRENHRTLTLRLRKYYPNSRHHWWIDNELSEPQPESPQPTTLHRLLGHRWEPEIMEKLSENTCCSLDSDGVFEWRLEAKNFTLKCLASRLIQEEDLSELPLALKCFASRHRTLQQNDVIIY